MIFESKSPSKEFPDVTLYNYLFQTNKEFTADQPCYVDAEDHSKLLTFGEVDTFILKFGAGLKRVFPDFKQGDVVAFYSTNELDYAAAVHGPVVVGGVSAAVDGTADIATAAHCLETVEAKILIVSIETVDKGLETAKLANIPTENIFVFGDEDHGEVRSFNKIFLDSDELAIPIEYTPEELATVPCFFYFTSGTTGKKKAVTMTHKLLLSAMILKEDMPLPKTMRLLNHTDFHHASVLLMVMHTYIMKGCTTYILRKYSLEKMLRVIQDTKINVFVTQPWIMAALVKEPIVEKYDISSVILIVCGGSCIDKSICNAFYSRFKVALINGYGMTEIVNLLNSSFESTMAGELGSLSAGFSCKLIDNEGQEVGYNTIGELCVRGPTLTPGYHNALDATAAAIDNEGFIHTGDLVKMTEEESLVYVDRAKDIIKYHEYHIIPQVIESVLLSHPLVSDCAAISEYSQDQATWFPKGVVMLAATDRDHDEIKEEILELIKTQLPDYMQLRAGLYIARTLPRTSTGKVERFKLRLNDIREWLY